MMDIIISDGTAIRAMQRYDWLTGFLSAVSIMAAGIGISRVMAKIEQSHPVIKRGFYFLLNGVAASFLITSCMSSQISEAVDQQSYSEDKVTNQQLQLIFENCKVFPNNTVISIAIIKDGIPRFYGINRKENSILSMENRDLVFEIGSITKVFTSTLLADFVIAGKLGLKDQIKDYITLKDNVTITFEQLANHSSGLPRLPAYFESDLVDPENPYKDYDQKKLKGYLTGELELSQSPGEKYQYSNLGAGLLGFLLSKIDGRSYEELLQQEIFSKYNMTDSTTDREKIADKLVRGIDAEGNEVANWDDQDVTVGAGGILSNANDLSKFALAHFNDSNEELALIGTPTFPVSDDMVIGLGWHILKNESETDWLWHNGGSGGYCSSMAIDKKRRTGVIILANISSYHEYADNIDNLCFALMKTLEDK